MLLVECLKIVKKMLLIPMQGRTPTVASQKAKLSTDAGFNIKLQIVSRPIFSNNHLLSDDRLSLL